MGSQMGTSLVADTHQGNNEYNINVENLPVGIYFAEVILNGTPVSTRKFTVSK